MSNMQVNTGFPYGEDRYFAPRTAGVIVDTGDIPVGSIEQPPPGGMTVNSSKQVVMLAEMTEYIGDTTCVSANQINYAQMAGTD